uniref:nucleolar and spindle-associated protein 1-like isoform X3 n=1 Tax=Ciona intestinalis TaxID=7719 RepID=UPI000EF4EAD2|nr:nucleolar and spindle-associated protein 1-like isoform X3 [Ciona intestinalis]|eukprot:XP_026692451.1 nucleolar and spindle-associated protein 1-like isoform X3 [Ciona intestinalis]
MPLVKIVRSADLPHIFSEMENVNLHELKRSALQKLAKQYGVKANIKNQKIIEQLTAIFSSGKENLSPINRSNGEIQSDTTDDSMSDQMSFRTPENKSENDISGCQLLDSIKPIWDDLSDENMDSSVEEEKKENTTPISTEVQENKNHVTPKVSNVEHHKIQSSSTTKKEKTVTIQSVSMTQKVTSVGKTASSIPKFAVAGLTVTNSSKKWSKVHEKRFDQMESIDDYQRRKKERADRLLGTGDKKRTLERLAQPKLKTPVSKRKQTLFSPANVSKPKRATRTAVHIVKPSTFKPSSVSINQINTNFSKTSRLVTPKKVNVTFGKTPKSSRKVSKDTTLKTPTSKPSLTPMRKSCATPQSARKSGFNLVESLKKPLTWKPHKGPLKKFSDSTTKPTFETRVKNHKQVKVTTRESRRDAVRSGRKSAKDAALMKRRGIKC